uniref:Uncharacterized protein n=1 Tax=Quercus lobata TaxID=97700 RepID=A0A7N2MZZ9_QUELO
MTSNSLKLGLIIIIGKASLSEWSQFRSFYVPNMVGAAEVAKERNALFHLIREMPIIGGLVFFDWHVDFCNLTSGDAIVEYHVVGLVAIHY